MKTIIYPDELEMMKLEKTILPSIDSNVGIACLSEEEKGVYVLRIYQLLSNENNGVYEVVQELAAFSFHSSDELVSFVQKLPQLNGIEMLLLLNPLNEPFTMLN